LYFGTAEMFSFLIFAMTCVIFISSKYWVRGVIALIAGVLLGLVGMDPNTAESLVGSQLSLILIGQRGS